VKGHSFQSIQHGNNGHQQYGPGLLYVPGGMCQCQQPAAAAINMQIIAATPDAVSAYRLPFRSSGPSNTGGVGWLTRR
jgi:hypothetical protein